MPVSEPMDVGDDGASVASIEELDHESVASIEVLDGASSGATITQPASPVAKTLICNRCTAEIFGSNDLSPSACCGNMICSLCWTAIGRLESERCSRLGCENVLLKRVRVFLSEDPYDTLSKNRDISRQAIANSDPINQQLTDDVAVLEARLKQQNQRLDDQTEMQVTLDSQIQHAAGRLEAVNRDIASLKNLHDKTRNRTYEVMARNDELSAKIDLLKEQITNVNGITIPPNALA